MLYAGCPGFAVHRTWSENSPINIWGYCVQGTVYTCTALLILIHILAVGHYFFVVTGTKIEMEIERDIDQYIVLNKKPPPLQIDNICVSIISLYS